MRYDNEVLADIIDRYVHSDLDRRIIKRRLIDGVRLEPLAEEFGYSSRHMRRKCKILSTEVLSIYQEKMTSP